MDRLLLLPNGNIEDYGEAAVWADTIPPAKNPLAYTKPYHYVSLPQNGVGQCSKYTSRTSCTNDACMVTGFETFTKKFQCNPRNKQNQRAIRFLLHFLGDISQPLHILDFHRGGTTLFHQWRGQSMSLHYIWDTAMPNQLLRDNIDEYVQELERKIKGGDYKKYVSDWNQCLTDNERNPNACIVPWIDKFNAFFNCKILLPKYEQLKRSKDFSVDYYAQHKAYLPVLWARAAVRAAKYITLFLE
ncbi:S1/P1 nuclease, partial [Syncephalis plumigaleata]